MSSDGYIYAANASYTNEKEFIQALLPLDRGQYGTVGFSSYSFTRSGFFSYFWIPNTNATNAIVRAQYGTLVLYGGINAVSDMYIISYANGTYKVSKVTLTEVA